MADIDRLEAVLGEIIAHPETHEQRMWATKTECGTSYCFAGHAVSMFAGEEWEWSWTGAGLAAAYTQAWSSTPRLL